MSVDIYESHNARIADLEAECNRLDILAEQEADRVAACYRRIAELEATLNGLADLWLAAPTSFGTTKEWDAGFVAGLEAFRASIRRTIDETARTAP